MAKTLSDAALDAVFEYIADRAGLITLCTGAPATAAEASTAVSGGGRMVANAALQVGLGGEDFGAASGLTSGRRLVVAAQAAVEAAEAGTVDHLALVDQAGSELLAVTELTESETLTSGQVISVKAYAMEIQAPV